MNKKEINKLTFNELINYCSELVNDVNKLVERRENTQSNRLDGESKDVID